MHCMCRTVGVHGESPCPGRRYGGEFCAGLRAPLALATVARLLGGGRDQQELTSQEREVHSGTQHMEPTTCSSLWLPSPRLALPPEDPAAAMQGRRRR
jgi:hypothetical protein